VAAGCDRELTRDGRKYALHLVAQGDKNGDGDHGNEGENQGVLHESLALLALHPAQRALGAGNYFVDHCFLTTFHKKLFLGENLGAPLLPFFRPDLWENKIISYAKGKHAQKAYF
jgi:hypothetical protein